MKIIETDISAIDNTPATTPTVYDSIGFCALNACRADRTAAFAAVDDSGRVMASQILGLRDGVWRAPFSAPFSAPRIAPHASDDTAARFYTALRRHTGLPLKIVLPPPPYMPPIPCPDGARVVDDANFHYDMARFADYEHWLSRSGRYSHHRGMKTDWQFTRTDDIARAYAVIEANRRAMGYPLAMSLEQVIATVSGPVEADFFLLSHDGRDMAAAMIYRVTPQAMQVIYWGDLPEARPLRAMNHLAWRVMQWYATNRPEIHTVDIGPSSADGVRNEGLCAFKLSIGCTETIRPTIWLD